MPDLSPIFLSNDQMFFQRHCVSYSIDGLPLLGAWLFLSTVGQDEAAIRSYIKNQETWDLENRKLDMLTSKNCKHLKGSLAQQLKGIGTLLQTKALIQHGGNKAFYSPSHDSIQMPPPQTFHDIEGYYATLAHEITHWTNHSSRLDRKFGQKRCGNHAYAMEELVAEIGSAFLCAGLGITPETREDHAAYIQSWLTVLKNDSRAIFTAASHAQRAVDYLQGLSTSIEA